MDVSGITEKGWAAVDRITEKFLEGMDIEAIAESEGMDVAALRVLVGTATLWEEKYGRS